MKPTNEAIIIEVSSPLLRAGLILRTQTSKKYAADAALDLIEIARVINEASSK
jgi:hypothetical protein